MIFNTPQCEAASSEQFDPMPVTAQSRVAGAASVGELRPDFVRLWT